MFLECAADFHQATSTLGTGSESFRSASSKSPNAFHSGLTLGRTRLVPPKTCSRGLILTIVRVNSWHPMGSADLIFDLRGRRLIARLVELFARIGTQLVMKMEDVISVQLRYSSSEKKRPLSSLSGTRSSTWNFWQTGSGPGGRRFKSSLPDHSVKSLHRILCCTERSLRLSTRR